MTEIKKAEPQSDVNQHTTDKTAIRWIRISLFSLLIVEILGCAVRYKFPGSIRTNVQYAHDSFICAGWLTQILMTLLVRYLANRTNTKAVWKKYSWLLWANLLTAYGTLIALLTLGYGFVSVIISTLSIFTSYAFTIFYWPDLNRLPKRLISPSWFKAALVWNVISSVGAFMVAYLVLTKVNNPPWFRAAICLKMHFQYNGWFLFACGGLLYGSNIVKTKEVRNVFYMMLLSCAPAYLIIILSPEMTTIPYGIAILAGIIQFIGWISILSQTINGGVVLARYLRPTVGTLLAVAGLAGTLKFFWEIAATYPAVLRLALTNETLVVAYLQIAFIGLLTMFILAYLFHNSSIEAGGWRKRGVEIFILGFILEMTALMLKAFGDITSDLVQLAPQCIMLFGVILLNIGAAMKVVKKENPKPLVSPKMNRRQNSNNDNNYQ
jgi:hypothetical protein